MTSPEKGTKDIFADVDKRAGAVLEHILKTELTNEPTVPKVSVEAALSDQPIIQHDSGRNASRVLFVTTDESVLIPGSLAQQSYLDRAEEFDELHILVLVARRGTDAFERVAPKVWLYRTHHRYWWRLPYSAEAAAKAALVFNGSIRPDIIVGIDPFEAGMGAYRIAALFERPLQLHVVTSFFSHAYITQSGTWWRRRIANWLLRHVGSVRTTTAVVCAQIKKTYPHIQEVEVLPQFYNFSGLVQATPAFDLHKKYPGFSFIMITFGSLTADSPLHQVFTATRKLLLNPRIGLLVLGDGPARSLFEKKVQLLGIERSVVFVTSGADIVSHLKTADLLIEADNRPDSEVHVLQAATVGLPIVAVVTETRRDLFEDGRSALLYPPDDLLALSQKINQFINSMGLRTQLRQHSQNVATLRLHEDAKAYYSAYRATIESVLLPPATTVPELSTPAESTGNGTVIEKLAV